MGQGRGEGRGAGDSVRSVWLASGGGSQRTPWAPEQGHTVCGRDGFHLIRKQPPCPAPGRAEAGAPPPLPQRVSQRGALQLVPASAREALREPQLCCPVANAEDSPHHRPAADSWESPGDVTPPTGRGLLPPPGQP